MWTAPCALHGTYGRPIAICMALCTDDLPVRGGNSQDLNASERHGCGAAHILLKLRCKGENSVVSKIPDI